MAVATVQLEVTGTDKITDAANKVKQLGEDVNKATSQAKGITSVGGLFKSLASDVGQFGDIFKKSLSEGKGVGDSLTSAFGGVGDAIYKSLGSMDPYAMAITAVAAAALSAAAAVAALGAAYVGIAVHAIEVVEKQEAMIAKFQGFTGQGKETVAMLGDLAKTLPYTTGELGDMAAKIAKAGVKDLPTLRAATLATAAAMAMMGEEGAKKMEKLFVSIQTMKDSGKPISNLTSQLNKAGVGASDVAAKFNMTAKEMEAAMKKGKISADDLGDAISQTMAEKAGPSLEALGLQFGTMMKKLQASWNGLLKDDPKAKTQPMADAVHELMSAFKMLMETFGNLGGASQATGAGLKSTLVVAFHAVAAAILYSRHILLEIINVVLRSVVAFNKFKATAAGAMTIKIALMAIKGVMLGLGILIAAVAATIVGSFLLIGGAVALVVGVISAIIGAIVAVGVAVIGVAKWIIGGIASIAGAIMGWGAQVGGYVRSAVASVIEALVGLVTGGQSAAGNFISGLVGGISSGTGMVIQAIKALAGGAVGALKSALGIGSPSKVMMQMGLHTSSGMAEGVKAGSGKVQDASASLGTSAVKGAAGGASEGKGAMSVVCNFASGAIVVQGSGGQDNQVTLTEQAVALIFERMALEAGLGST